MVGDGFTVHNFIPNGARIANNRMSPFYMLDYNALQILEPSDEPRGVGVHPHRGFETVTIAYAGSIAHHDSRGNSGVIHPGDVQWMTAAYGVLHKEYHEESFSKKGGPFQMVQLWVNLPAKYKMTAPAYQAIEATDIVRVSMEDNTGTVEIIAGSYQGQVGPAKTFTPLALFNIRLQRGASLTIPSEEAFNTGLLAIEGDSEIQGNQLLQQDHFALLANDGDALTITALSDCVILYLSGAAINEPIAAYGPFLMNHPSELQQAIADYHDGKFGTLKD
jgi:redox-sensitive bicupin YhaK (pirin superfamily)